MLSWPLQNSDGVFLGAEEYSRRSIKDTVIYIIVDVLHIIHGKYNIDVRNESHIISFYLQAYTLGMCVYALFGPYPTLRPRPPASPV